MLKMKYTATCPSCQKEISIITIMLALTPFSFKCTKCRTRIYIKGIRLQLFGIVALMGVGIVLLMQYLWSKQGANISMLLWPALLLILMEFILGAFVCNRARFEVKK